MRRTHLCWRRLNSATYNKSITFLTVKWKPQKFLLLLPKYEPSSFQTWSSKPDLIFIICVHSLLAISGLIAAYKEGHLLQYCLILAESTWR